MHKLSDLHKAAKAIKAHGLASHGQAVTYLGDLTKAVRSLATSSRKADAPKILSDAEYFGHLGAVTKATDSYTAALLLFKNAYDTYCRQLFAHLDSMAAGMNIELDNENTNAPGGDISSPGELDLSPELSPALRTKLASHGISGQDLAKALVAGLKPLTFNKRGRPARTPQWLENRHLTGRE